MKMAQTVRPRGIPSHCESQGEIPSQGGIPSQGEIPSQGGREEKVRAYEKEEKEEKEAQQGCGKHTWQLCNSYEKLLFHFKIIIAIVNIAKVPETKLTYKFKSRWKNKLRYIDIEFSRWRGEIFKKVKITFL